MIRHCSDYFPAWGQAKEERPLMERWLEINRVQVRITAAGISGESIMFPISLKKRTTQGGDWIAQLFFHLMPKFALAGAKFNLWFTRLTAVDFKSTLSSLKYRGGVFETLMKVEKLGDLARIFGWHCGSPAVDLQSFIHQGFINIDKQHHIWSVVMGLGLVRIWKGGE